MNTLVDLLAESAGRWPEQPALYLAQGDDTWHWTYAELWDAAQRAAAYLTSIGVERGDRVIIWGPNRPEWVAAFYGALMIGAPVVPLDIRTHHDFLQRIEERTEPKHLFLGEEQAAGLSGAHPPVTRIDQLREHLAAVEPRPVDRASIAADDLAEIVFTSGTTGNPKGVLLTHRNILANARGARASAPTSPAYRALSLLPLSHMFEQTMGLFTLLMGGASITYMSTLRPDVIFATMAERKITAMGCVPQVLTLFRRGIEMQVKAQKKEAQFAKLHKVARYLPRRVRRLLFRPVLSKMGGEFDFFVAGGAYLDPEVARWWERMGVRVLQGYGMTEAAPIITCHSVFRRDDVSVGWPLPGLDIRIADDGEIQIRGESVSKGYWNDPEATAAGFEDGWYKTGDLGSIDKDGRLFLRGRKKNMIVLANGMKVHPEDLEHILLSDARIKDAVVVGTTRGQDVEVHAVLLTKEPEAVPDILRTANGKLAPHQQIRRHTIWPDESFPLTPTLKPKRAEIMAKLTELEPVRA